MQYGVFVIYYKSRNKGRNRQILCQKHSNNKYKRTRETLKAYSNFPGSLNDPESKGDTTRKKAGKAYRKFV